MIDVPEISNIETLNDGGWYDPEAPGIFNDDKEKLEMIRAKMNLIILSVNNLLRATEWIVSILEKKHE